MPELEHEVPDDRDVLANRALRREFAWLADELHAAIDEGHSGEALHHVIGLWEANTEEVTYASLVEGAKPSACADCGTDVTPYDDDGRPTEGGWKWYMVTTEVWQVATAADGADVRYLCIGCLERRLGRVLVPSDFGPWSVNEASWLNTSRLRDRLGHPEEAPKSER